MKPQCLCVWLWVAASLPFVSITVTGADARKSGNAARRKVDFQNDIKPLLEQSCIHCHGAERPKSRFRVDSRSAMIEGGASGEAAIVPGQSENSPVVRYVAGLVEEMEMPPLAERGKYPALTPEQIALLRAWIDQGASWPEGVVIASAARSTGKQASDATTGAENKAEALFKHIREGNTKAVARVLKDEPLLHVRDADGNTPLILAAFYSDAATLSGLLALGADPNATNKAGATALMKAVADLGKVRTLLKHGAKVNVASAAGNTALIIAAYENGSSAVLKELLAHGADVLAANHRGITAVYAAAQAGDAEAIRTLLKSGGNVNSTGQLPNYHAPVTALMVAAMYGYFDCVNLLIRRGADVHVMSEYGNALHFATFSDRREIAHVLLDRGIKVNLPGRRLSSFRNDTGLTPLIYAAMSERNDETLVQRLIDLGADLNAKASSGETALANARRRGATKIVSALKAAGAVCAEENDVRPNGSSLWRRDHTETPDAAALRQAAEKSLAVLLTSGSRFTEVTANRCFSCHQQSQPAIAVAVARQRGVHYDRSVASEQLRATLSAAAVRKEICTEEPLPVPSIPAWLLIGLHASGHPGDTITDAYAYSLARSQYSDGRWVSKAARAPTDYTDVTSTALAIRALKAYPPPAMKIAFERRTQRAAEWLRGYKAATTEERALQILGLSWAGSQRAELARFTKALLTEQRPDGGWAQLETLESDPYATGLSLYALYEGGGLRPADPIYSKGLKFLLNAQLDNGSWFVRTRASPVQVAVDDIFPHGKHQWISTVAGTWSSMALMLALDQKAN